MRRALSFIFAFALLSATVPAQEMRLPLKKDSLLFAVIGDSGTGDSNQRRVADALYKERTRVPFNIVLMMGDNLYGTANFLS
jgi:hypothetical protein